MEAPQVGARGTHADVDWLSLIPKTDERKQKALTYLLYNKL